MFGAADKRFDKGNHRKVYVIFPHMSRITPTRLVSEPLHQTGLPSKITALRENYIAERERSPSLFLAFALLNEVHESSTKFEALEVSFQASTRLG